MPGQRSLICQSWDQTTFTLDYVQPKDNKNSDLAPLLKSIQKKIGYEIEIGQLRLVQASKEIRSVQNLNYDYTLRVELRGPLPGGKGGYGSLLRSMKPKAKADENYEACRDLSGRRLRHVNNQERLREWRQRQEEEAKYVEEETKEYERNKQQLKQAIHQNNFKLDDKFKQQMQDGANSVSESVKEAGEALMQAKRNKKANNKKKMKGSGLNLEELLKDEKSSDLDALFGGFKAKKRIKLTDQKDQFSTNKGKNSSKMQDNEDKEIEQQEPKEPEGMIKIVEGGDDD